MVQLNPNMSFIRALNGSVDNALKKCIQCGTCSAGCNLSPASSPFPRKEMAMAALGMKDALLGDPDVWLCYQCNDCTRNCPRGARPGDVLAAIRKESIVHFAFPRFMAKWISRPLFFPLSVLLPALLLGAAVVFQSTLADVLHITPSLGDKIVYPHSAHLPHWLLNRFFFVVVAWALTAMLIGTIRFSRAMNARASSNGATKKVRTLRSSMIFALKQALTHAQFETCEASSSKRMAHFSVLFGFLALVMVTSWVITAGFNPLVTTRFVYPFAFLSPFKILANLGGAALLFGCTAMVWERLKPDPKRVGSTYFDWLFLLTLLFVVLTGFATEALHYLRIVPLRHVIYFGHLVAVTVLILNLPFTKFAHIFYRTAAIVFAAQLGREGMILERPAVGEKGEGE